MGKLKHSVFLRESVASSPVGFKAGTELPDWAWELVKDKKHLQENPEADLQPVTLPKPADQDEEVDYESAATTENILPKIDVIPEGDDEEEVEAPPRNASKARWLAFAKEAKEDGFPVELTGSEDRDGLIDACVAAGAVEYPDETK